MTDDARYSFGIPPVRDPNTGCLVFMGTLTKGGHPADGAHRKAAGAQPGEVVDHVYERGCRYRACIEPTHLEIVTREENIRRAVEVHKAGYRTWDRRGLLHDLGLLPVRWAHLGKVLSDHNKSHA